MKRGDLVSAVDKTSYQRLWEGIGVLVRPDEGRTYVEWSNSWEILCNDGELRVIDGGDIEGVNENW